MLHISLYESRIYLSDRTNYQADLAAKLSSGVSLLMILSGTSTCKRAVLVFFAICDRRTYCSSPISQPINHKSHALLHNYPVPVEIRMLEQYRLSNNHASRISNLLQNAT